MANKALGNLNMKDPGCHMEPERWKKHMQYLKKEGVTTGSNGWGGRDARPGEDTAIIETPPPPPPISITQILGPIINTLIHHKGGRTVAMARTSADKLKAALTGGAGKFSSVRTSKQLLDKMKRRAGAMLAAENKRKAIGA